jgi:hypothetical protein
MDSSQFDLWKIPLNELLHLSETVEDPDLRLALLKKIKNFEAQALHLNEENIKFKNKYQVYEDLLLLIFNKPRED